MRVPHFGADVLQAVEGYRAALRALGAAEDAVRVAKQRGVADAIRAAEVLAADARSAVTEARCVLDATLVD